MAVSNIGGNECAVVANDFPGLAVMCMEKWTLSKKAQVLQGVVDQPIFTRHNLVDDLYMVNFGDFSSAQKGNSDNDGLWTSIYLLSQALRFASAKAIAAQQNALKFFSGMEFLNLVTGTPGLMARTVIHSSEPEKHTQFPWHVSTAYPGWVWKDDTSSDEVTGRA
jgi:hypothetical protein